MYNIRTIVHNLFDFFHTRKSTTQVWNQIQKTKPTTQGHQSRLGVPPIHRSPSASPQCEFPAFTTHRGPVCTIFAAYALTGLACTRAPTVLPARFAVWQIHTFVAYSCKARTRHASNAVFCFKLFPAVRAKVTLFTMFLVSEKTAKFNQDRRLSSNRTRSNTTPST